MFEKYLFEVVLIILILFFSFLGYYSYRKGKKVECKHYNIKMNPYMLCADCGKDLQFKGCD